MKAPTSLLLLFRFSRPSRLLLLFLLLSFSAQGQQTDFEKANNAYNQKEYEVALSLYDSLALTLTGVPLYYNIANCHYRLGHIPEAILNYERALKLNPDDDEVKTNLQIANQQLKDKIEALPNLGLNAALNRFSAFQTVQNMSLIALVLCFVAFSLLISALFLKARSFKRSALTLGIFMLLGALISLSVAYWGDHRLHENQEAIIMVDEVAVSSAPSEEENPIFVLHGGTKVKVMTTRGKWAEIKIANGSVGWLLFSELRII